MKPKKTLTVLTALWILLVFLEGISSIIRRWYTRNMGGAARAFSGAVSFGKMAAMIVLAISNVLLFLKHVGGDGDGAGDGRFDVLGR
jgi:hypothetical protein